MRVEAQDTTVVAYEWFGAVARSCGVMAYYPSVEDGTRTVELLSMEGNFGCMDAVARLAKTKKTA